MRRAAATDCSQSRLVGLMFLSRTWCRSDAHPLQGGILRRNTGGSPSDHAGRAGLVFYPKYWWSFTRNSFIELRVMLWLLWKSQRIYKDKNRHAYVDQALTLVTDDETETLELFTHSEAARQSVKHIQKVAQLTGRNAA